MTALDTWKPVLNGELRTQALAVADEIATEIQLLGKELIHDGSLASGHAGIATMFAYLDRALPGRGFGDAGADHLNAALDFLADSQLLPDLYCGFTGIAWAAAQVDRLAGHRNVEGDEFSQIDDLLLDVLSVESWSYHYDLISGLVGLGAYALERLPNPRAHSCLTRVVEHLSRWAERGPEGVTWRTPVNLLAESRHTARPNGEYNLGLAHGVPGAIALLAQASAAGAAAEEAAMLVDQSIPWLLKQRIANSPGASFGYDVSVDDDLGPSRSAWCYGDPGVAAALLCAARCRGNVTWEREAIELAVAAANRPESAMAVCDAGLCHGWAGLAHLFNRLYQTSGDARFVEPTQRFFKRTLEIRRKDGGIAGYSAWQAGFDIAGGWRDEPGLLEGAAGVALALAAAATDVEPTWDTFLLISNTVIS